MLKDKVDAGFDVLEKVLENTPPRIRVQQYGTVSFVGSGIAEVRGIHGARYEELIRFAGDHLGVAFNVGEADIGVVLLCESETISAGGEARRTDRVLDVPVGDDLLGRILDAQGRPLDGRGRPRTSARRSIEQPAPEIMDRSPVTEPLQTGLKVIDALLPIGRGQRELILGDRQTGKTAVAVDALLNQRDSDVVCIYCAIGKRTSAVARVIATLKEHDAIEDSMVIIATEEDPPGLQFIAPYTAMTMGEHFMNQGQNVLLVLDDLTRHARAYRELSLLLRRPPGREAFPGDIFYIHARLLERSTHLHEDLGGGSLTALPIVETEAQNLSAYIPTNLISITDGQIYLSPRLFSKGILPAVDVGKSVSRVGGKSQLAAYRRISGDLRLAYSQFEELESFSRFGTRMDEETRKTLARGRRVREILKQPQYSPLSVPEQMAGLVAANEGVLDPVPIGQIAKAEQHICRAVTESQPEICRSIESGEDLDEEDIRSLAERAKQAIREHGLAEKEER
jgi:F-type H+-transporting ATPase subunit alpha